MATIAPELLLQPTCNLVATLDGTIIVTKNSLVGPDCNGNFDRNVHNKLEQVVTPI
jgi:hypothetical protein